ncbi:serine/threonine-protein kinase [Cylindrospermopsis raciborskii]|uniref:serine/threonine-protein kinase n=1 Tax=Cylindrospermopsis raciborskii TaxID=77022 RepID=UPI001F4551E5|nr:serine/threonine-protein kinase [Cylindrospermopsis raciborskii]UJS06209.1 serine/threonine-protein kinase [Cylindrospermopsis raciborskii KLL07]
MLISWQPGESIANGRFTIQEVLGTGGFGITYKVKDKKGQIYALKTLNATMQNRDDFKEQQLKFINEALTLKGFSHPQIVKVYEMIQEKELFGVLMEYIDGISVSKYIERNGKLTEALSLTYIDQISQALQYIHKNNYLHRDVKPDNILLRNNSEQAVLIDFGLARIIATQNMTNLFTHGYSPIEQYQTEGNFGHHTDIYALAATLYYLLTATIPVSAFNRKINEQELPEPISYNPSISERVNNAIITAMAIEPQHRTKNIEEFRKNLGLITEVTPTEIPTETSSEDKKINIKKIRFFQNGIKRFLGLAGFTVILIILTIIGQKLNEEKKSITITTEVSESPATTARYTKLENLLKAQSFPEANDETNRIMLEIANRQNEDWLTTEDAEKFPCEELRTIDHLWLKYSQGKFGISVQQDIYQNLGGTKKLDLNVWRSFGERVGWRINNQWLKHSNLNFSLSAPDGHLPVIGEIGFGRWSGNLLPPISECKTLNL